MKVTISKLFELSKYLGTNAGKELEGALSYLSDFAELTVRGLTNQLTFEDNLNCEQKRISVRNNMETIVSIASRKRPTRIYIDRVISPYYVVTGFGWQFNAAGQVVLKCLFDGSPPTAQDISLDITIFYG
jgi:hypothetical protein